MEATDISPATSSTTPQTEISKNHLLLALHAVYARNRDVAAYDVSWDSADDAESDDGLSRLHAQLMAGYARRPRHGTDTVPTILKLTSDSLLNRELPELPRADYIIEVPWQRCNEPQLRAVQMLAAQGYRLSVSGLRPCCGVSAELLDLVHMVRLDIAQLGLNDAFQVRDELRQYSLDLLASNLTDRDTFKACFEAGFHLFSGDLFGKPTPTGRRVGHDKVVLLHLLAELQKPSATGQFSFRGSAQTD